MVTDTSARHTQVRQIWTWFSVMFLVLLVTSCLLSIKIEAVEQQLFYDSGRNVSLGGTASYYIKKIAPATDLAQTYGRTGVRPVWDGNAPPQDGVGVRFRFYVADNNSHNLKILFSDSRLCGTQPDTYLLEYNLYDRGLRYDDWVYTTWPMQGTHVPGESSLRVAVPDYVAAGKTGAKTFSPEMFPRQTYEIDGIAGVWKTDLISQTNMNQRECGVTMMRGGLVTDLSGWRADGTDLPADTYRQWNVTVEFGQATYQMAFALPDGNASYLDPWETLIFFTEFLHSSGLLRVYFWDFQIMRESLGIWEPLYRWRVSDHDGSLDSFGVCKASHNGVAVIEISNDPAMDYPPPGTIIDTAPTEEKAIVLFLESHDPIWTNQTERGLDNLCEVLNEEGFEWAVHEEGSLTTNDLDTVDVLVVGYSNAGFASNELDTIEDFVRTGGGLLLMGEGWSWPSDISAFPLNQLAYRFGWEITASTGDAPAQVFEHPISTGVSSLHLVGSSPIAGTAGDTVILDQNGEALVRALHADAGHVVTIGDSDIFTNVDYNGNGIPVIEEEDNTLFARNVFHWLTGSSGVPCTYSMDPASRNFSHTGGSGSVSVTTESGCQWTAQTDVAWITITSGGSGPGSGMVNYTVAANSGATRTGHITIEGQTHTVTQGGEEPVPGSGDILFDQRDQHHYGDQLFPDIDSTGTIGYSTFRTTLENAGYEINKLNSGLITNAILANYKILVIMPTLHNYSSSEINAIESYVSGGGSVLILGDWFQYAPHINAVAEAFDTKFDGHRVANSTSNLNGDPFHPRIRNFGCSSPPCNHSLTHITDGIESYYMVNGTFIEAGSPDKALAWFDWRESPNQPREHTWIDQNKNGYEDPGEEYRPGHGSCTVLSWLEYENGKVVFSADASFLYNSVADKADNLQLGLNIISWLAETTSEPGPPPPSDQETHTFPAGWSLVSVPLNSGMAAELFGTVAYRWNPATGQYDMPTIIEPTKGYWVNLPSSRTVTDTGHEVTTDVIIDISSKGWHQISAPWSYPKSAIKVIKGTETKFWADAVTAGWVRDDIYGYVATDGAYTTPSTIDPWYGYWVRANVSGLTLKLLYASGTPVSTAYAPMAFAPADLPPMPPAFKPSAATLTFGNSPNPVVDVHTTIFEVKGAAAYLVDTIKVQIFDLSGRLVYSSGEIAGTSVDWHTENDYGETLANGVYLYRMYANIGGEWIESKTKKLAILR